MATVDPTKEAALYQAKQLRAQGKSESEIAAILKQAGASTRAISEATTLAPAKDDILIHKDVESIRAILNGCISWLESVGVRANKAADKFPDLASLRNEANNWQRKIKGVIP